MRRAMEALTATAIPVVLERDRLVVVVVPDPDGLQYSKCQAVGDQHGFSVPLRVVLVEPVRETLPVVTIGVPVGANVASLPRDMPLEFVAVIR